MGGEDGPYSADDLAEEGVDPVRDALEGGFAVRACEDRDAVREGVAGQVSPGEQAQLAAGDEDDVRAVTAQSFGPLGAVEAISWLPRTLALPCVRPHPRVRTRCRVRDGAAAS